MKKIFFAALAAAMVGVSLTSCSNDDEIVSGSNQGMSNAKPAIAWKAGLNNRLVSTRGTAIAGTNYLSQTLVPNMQVWGFFVPTATGEGINGGDQYVGTGGAGIIIDNKSTESPVNNLWEYNDISQMAYWPTQPLNFYAIIPANDGSFTVTNAGTTNNLGHIVADVTVPTEVENQKDIMFAQAENEGGRTAADNHPVGFTFNHALSQVVFSGKLASKNLSAEIESITVCNADQKGKVGFLTDNNNNTVILGSEIDASHTVAKYAAGLVTDATLNGTENVNVAKNLSALSGALMMLPQNRTADKWDPANGAAEQKPISGADTNKKTYLAISCKIKNGNAYVMGSDAAYATVYIPFEINWEQGKKYTYTLVFGNGQGGYDENGDPLDSMLPITYTVSSVTDWSAVEGGEIEF